MINRVIEDCELHEVLSKNGSISGVVTSKGYIKCKYFVNTAGMWARNVGYLSNPRVQVYLTFIIYEWFIYKIESFV